MATPTWPFEGLPLAWAVLFTICLVVVVAMFCWTLLLFVRGHKAIARPPQPPPEGADAFSWVFLVPALNEEVTIADSVQRLIELPVARRRVIVIDDGSDDRTAEILAGIDHPDLFVLHRRAPDARQGKAAALNYAYRSLRGHADRERTIVVIVDADGRLRASAPHFAAAHFADPKVGGMQSLVRIYNRQHPLTWLQDVEFSVYGHLFQAGRDHWGTAGMGGNGQFNRLSALDTVANEEGPWRDKLTEDQDLGLRLIAAGWEGRQDLRAAVDQQGLSKWRPLFRQRTRWSQGNLQAMALRKAVIHAPVARSARVEQLAYLLMPFWQGIVGLGLLGALFLAITGTAPFWGAGPTWQFAFFYLLAFGGTALGCIAARSEQGPLGWLKGFLIAQVYTPYTWFLWPVLVRSTARQLFGSGSWAKTEREPISEGGSPARSKASPAAAAAAAPRAPSGGFCSGRAP
ncbi:MAG TPA: glycosyltransferase family 2 protein [Solirubrobacterales bacterium]|nr:glycosyltransferase family 2 protein [Solirubrobacterales bacterium]